MVAMEHDPYGTPQGYAPPRAVESKVRVIGLTVAGLMFFISLGGSTIISGQDKGFLLGFVCLLFGWGASYLAWYANPFIFLSGLLLLLNRPLWAAGSAAIAVGLCLTTFQIQTILINEAGTKGPVTGYGWGFYLWLGSSLVLLATSVTCLVMRRGNQINSFASRQSR